MAEGGTFIDQFIDEYFSEAEEHLATIRRVVLEMERAPENQLEPAHLQELLRALHTLKGLSGMVGLMAAEEIAHSMEDGVRGLPHDRPTPPALLELLFVGVAGLEACVEARRTGVAPISPGPFVDRMREVLRQVGSAPVDGGVWRPAAGTSSALTSTTPTVRKFQFAPSAELVARGVSVELIRQRLGSLGAIVATVPSVRSGGRVVFEFDVAIRGGAVPDEAWRTDGVSWELTGERDLREPVGVVVHSAQTRPSAGYVTGASNVVRVDLARLDDLMRMVGDLVVERARLADLLARARESGSAAAWDDLNDAGDAIERHVRLLREGVMRVRLVAVGEVFERMRFAMRDIARDTGREIRLEFSGQETEIDKLVVDRMLEPLLHLVRNAASHGIETRGDRIAAGKEPEGTITLRARAAGDRVVIEVQDDGAGMDAQRIAQRARELHLVATDEALAADALLEIICSPGFSTRETADKTSGRGVGMAVVRSTIRSLGGELLVDSVVGRGTRFTIELPLTLMITDALILEVGDQAMAIPQTSLREIVPLDPASVTPLEKNEVMSYRGRVIPLVNVGAVFKLRRRVDARRHVLIVGSDVHPAGLVVDRVLGLREIVVHPVSDPVIAVPGISGATELADGRVSLILDAAALVRDTRHRRVPGGATPILANPHSGTEQTWQ